VSGCLSEISTTANTCIPYFQVSAGSMSSLEPSPRRMLLVKLVRHSVVVALDCSEHLLTWI